MAKRAQKSKSSNLGMAHYELTLKIRAIEAERAAMIEAFGEDLARREGWSNFDGMEAVHFYLVKKHGWLPSTVRSMSTADFWLLLTEEMRDWHAPKECLALGLEVVPLRGASKFARLKLVDESSSE